MFTDSRTTIESDYKMQTTSSNMITGLSPMNQIHQHQDWIYYQLDLECQQVFGELDQQRQRERKRARRARKQRPPKSERQLHMHTSVLGNRRSFEKPHLEAHYIKKLMGIFKNGRYINSRLHAGVGYEIRLNADILDLLGRSKDFGGIGRAYVHVCFAYGDYSNMVDTIKAMHRAGSIALNWELEVEEFWDEAHYHLESKANGEQLNSVQRYRSRKKHPCPTISQLNPKKYKISKSAKDILDEQFLLNEQPDKSVKQSIALSTGLGFDTVSNWFKNKRQRNKYRSKKIVDLPYQTVEMSYESPESVITAPGSSSGYSSTSSSSQEMQPQQATTDYRLYNCGYTYDPTQDPWLYDSHVNVAMIPPVQCWQDCEQEPHPQNICYGYYPESYY